MFLYKIIIRVLKKSFSILATRLQKLDFDAKKKKDDDFTGQKPYMTGAVELELTLLTAEEAKLDPVGRKRKKPNHVNSCQCLFATA